MWQCAPNIGCPRVLLSKCPRLSHARTRHSPRTTCQPLATRYAQIHNAYPQRLVYRTLEKAVFAQSGLQQVVYAQVGGRVRACASE